MHGGIPWVHYIGWNNPHYRWGQHQKMANSLYIGDYIESSEWFQTQPFWRDCGPSDRDGFKTQRLISPDQTGPPPEGGEHVLFSSFGRKDPLKGAGLSEWSCWLIIIIIIITTVIIIRIIIIMDSWQSSQLTLHKIEKPSSPKTLNWFVDRRKTLLRLDPVTLCFRSQDLNLSGFWTVGLTERDVSQF